MRRSSVRGSLPPLLLLALAACAGAPRLDLGIAPAGVTLDARVVYYDIHGNSVPELRRSLVNDGPRVGERRFDGSTEWRVNWRYQYDTRSLAGCELARVQVVVRALVTMPRWLPDADADPVAVEWWQAFHESLLEHERGHARMAADAGRAIARELVGLRASNCGVVAEMANQRATRHVEELRVAQRRFDNTTAHGWRQIQAALVARGPQVAQAARVSRFPWPAAEPPPTAAGVGVGMPERDVESVIGSPMRVEHPAPGVRVLSYMGPARTVVVRAGEVQSVALEEPAAGRLDGIAVGDRVSDAYRRWGGRPIYRADGAMVWWTPDWEIVLFADARGRISALHLRRRLPTDAPPA